jgi:uncharacterized protein (TIGR03437 family)
VLFDRVAAPLIYVREDRISAVVRYGVSGKNTTQLQIVVGLTRSAPVTLRVVAAVPGIFTADSSGQVAAVNQDGTYNSPSSPAAKGSVVTFFATGEGQTDPPGIDGKLAVVPLPAPVLTVVVAINNMGAEIRYVGAAPGLVPLPHAEPVGAPGIHLSLHGLVRVQFDVHVPARLDHLDTFPHIGLCQARLRTDQACQERRHRVP